MTPDVTSEVSAYIEVTETEYYEIAKYVGDIIKRHIGHEWKRLHVESPHIQWEGCSLVFVKEQRTG